jgi:CDGSH-type Zn-finger protein
VFQPVLFTPETSEIIFLCGCKHTKIPPFCDGSDKEL